MFSLNEFVLKTVKGMINNYPDFQAIEYALNWYSKGVLTEIDLAEIEGMIEVKNTPNELIDSRTEKVKEPVNGNGDPDLEVINHLEMAVEPLT